LPNFVTFNTQNAYSVGNLSGTLRPFNSFLILLNLEKDLSPELLVTIKLRNTVRVVG